MQSLARVTFALARVLIEGPWRPAALISRLEAALDRKPRWSRRLARQLCTETLERRPTIARLAERLREFEPLRREWEQGNAQLSAAKVGEVFAPDQWQLPQVDTVGELADWFGLKLNELDWFMDRRWLESRTPPSRLCHYRSTWLTKRRGGARLLEAPKSRLKALQRRVLHEILDHIPPHGGAHGFVAGRSVPTFVAPHTAQAVVVRCDLRDFFPSINFARVVGLFLTAGYRTQVAYALAALCCHVTAEDVVESCPGQRRDRERARTLYRRPHLPQGAPTSPALANLCAYRLDVRLTGLAAAAGACYSRYADDLVISGDEGFARGIRRFVPHVMAIALDEGFEVNQHKTRVMRRGVRQSAAGVVLNVCTNVPRHEFDRLKATLHNSVRFGPASQNRDEHADYRSHLLGRIAWVKQLNPARGQKLRQLFDRIQW